MSEASVVPLAWGALGSETEVAGRLVSPGVVCEVRWGLCIPDTVSGRWDVGVGAVKCLCAAIKRRARAFFGGVPEVVLPDDLKSAVMRAAFLVRTEPILNRSYRELAQHFGFKIVVRKASGVGAPPAAPA